MGRGGGWILAGVLATLAGCAGVGARVAVAEGTGAGRSDRAGGSDAGARLEGGSAALELGAVVADAIAVHGEASAASIARGVEQVARLWRPEVDGDLGAFVRGHFLADPAQRDATFARLEAVLEQVDGHSLALGRALRAPSDVDSGPLLAVDALLAGTEPSAHLVEDLFRSKVAFVALLNFPVSTASERVARAAGLTRRDWAEARLTGRFGARIPAEVLAREAVARAEADGYISAYDLWLHHVVDASGRRLFPPGKRLISHWNLRDELKAQYAAAPGVTAGMRLARQRLIARVMARIVDQTIPAAVIGDPRVDWEPVANTVTLAPEQDVEPDGRGTRAVDLSGEREEDVRYARILKHFHAARAADSFVPSAPSPLARAFERDRELPVARVEALLTEVLASPVIPRLAALMKARLGRPLEPHDLWYDGFKPRARIAEAELDALVRARFPDAQTFERALGPILVSLGFPEAEAGRLAGLIRVDPSRGAGHAMPAAMRGDFPRLRTRIGEKGMDYKGFNIAIHELGHNVEQVYSLYDVDHTLLAGVPNNAFTEALAFVLQARDLQVLGLSAVSDPVADAERTLGTLLNTWELAGMALLEIGLWRWLEAHPAATPEALRGATVGLARTLWVRHYAPHLGDGAHGDGPLLLGIYSHLVSYPLYLAHYPLGHLIAFQVEDAITREGAAGVPLGVTFARVARIGAVAPDVWMLEASGAPVSAAPLLEGAERALSILASAHRPPGSTR
jgi:hypothetical protein